MARIGIDARFYNESGIGRYIRNLLFELSKIDKENEYFVFLLPKDYNRFDKTPIYQTGDAGEARLKLPTISIERSGLSLRNRKTMDFQSVEAYKLVSFPNNFKKVLADFGWYGISEQIKFPGLLKKFNLDLVHFPHFNVPIFYNGKFIVTIHDLIHQHFQMKRATTRNFLTYKLKQFGYKKVFENAVKKAEKILVPSEFVRDQLASDWLINNQKLVVTYEGVEGQLISTAAGCNQKEIQEVLEKFGVRQPYIFYVGNAHPHKNVEGLVKAFLELRGRYQYLQLVLSGNSHYFWERIKKDFKQKDIIYTGYVSDKELVALYKGAKVFVMPSFEEGFGIPLLEAMSCGTAVVSSNIGALKEVGGDACLYFDPHNTEDMKEKIMQVLNSEEVRNELIEKGKKRVKQFSWEKLAKETLTLYEELNVKKVL